ncbi:response regulator [Flavobacterium sp.]
MEPLRPFTILVADDDEDDREIFCELFTDDKRFALLGCCSSSFEVLDEITRKHTFPDILLVDMYMPLLTGIDLVRKLAEIQAVPHMFKFVISTTVNIAENESQLNDPHIGFLKKPVTMQEIKALPDLILSYIQQRLEQVS